MEYLNFYFLCALLHKHKKQLMDEYKIDFEYKPSTINYNKDELILSYNNTYCFTTNSSKWDMCRYFIIMQNINNMCHSFDYKLTPLTNVPIKIISNYGTYNTPIGMNPSKELEEFFVKVMEILTKLQNVVIQEKLSFVA